VIVYLARHGETNFNEEGRYQGQRESDLTPRGRLQAERLAHALQGLGVQRVISSPLGRCVESAKPLATRLKLPVEISADLIEIAHGTWEGRLRTEIEEHDPQMMSAWRGQPETVVFDGGESLAMVNARWNHFLGSLHGDMTTVVVTHDVVVRVALLASDDRPLARFWEPVVKNGAYAWLVKEGANVRVLNECVDAHLGDAAADISAQAL
jgi:broad specificity phosphatase PhoE